MTALLPVDIKEHLIKTIISNGPGLLPLARGFASGAHTEAELMGAAAQVLNGHFRGFNTSQAAPA